MAEWKGYNKFYIKVRGRFIRKSKIAISELGLILRRFQDIYEYTAKLASPTLEKDELLLYFSQIKEGSAIIEIQHEEWEPNLSFQYEKPDKLFNDLFDAVLEPDYQNGRTKFNELFKNPISRVELLRKLENFWSTHYRRISIGFGKDIDQINFNRLMRPYKQRITTWLKKEEEELTKNIEGFIIRIKYDHPANFTVVDNIGNIIKGRLTKTLKPDIHKYATKLVRINAILRTKGREYSFEKVNSIIPIPNITFKDNVGGLKINHQLTFEVEWFEDGIVLYEPQLNLSVFVKNLAEKGEELRDYLEILKEQYIDESEDKLNEKAKSFRNALIDLLGYE